MTCIIGFADKKTGRVYIGGDSAGFDESSFNIQIRGDTKVFRTGPLLIGFTSSFRMGQLLRYSLNIPEPQVKGDDMRYMVAQLVPAIRKCFEVGGFQKDDNGQEEGGTFLIGYNGNLYEVEDDYQVAIPADGITAVGSGGEIALGAMHAMSLSCPRKSIKKALEIVTYLNATVRPPFIIEEL